MVTVTLGVLTITTQSIHGRTVREHLGIVSGDAVVWLAPHTRRGSRMTRGAIRARHSALHAARQRSIQALAQLANERGATVVLDVRLEYVPLGSNGLLITTTGTAVRF
jgi:uncharacterized protein YbjQ (UPF0145 family)